MFLPELFSLHEIKYLWLPLTNVITNWWQRPWRWYIVQ
jgi:hypothetical protein